MLLRRDGSCCVAGVRRAGRLDEEDMCLLVGARAVLDAARDDEELARAKVDVAITQLDRQATCQHEEEVVRLVVLVPDELAFYLDELHLVVVQASDDLRAPAVVERRQLVGEVDRLGRSAAHSSSVSPSAGTTTSGTS